LDARQAAGRWYVRIEDLDPPREQAGAAQSILRTLERFGLHWDGEVVYQRDRHAAYLDALEQLFAQGGGALFPCTCSRTVLAGESTAATDEGPRYAGRCRQRVVAQGPSASVAGDAAIAWRLRVPHEEAPVYFDDRVQGPQQCVPGREIGDFVLRRRDGLFAYQLAVAVDDHAQGITHIVRGTDLLTSTYRQLLVLRRLGLPRPRYAHVPVAVTASGQKLSKQSGARSIETAPVSPLLHRALAYLQQRPPTELVDASPDDVLAWAIDAWAPDKFWGKRQIDVEASGDCEAE
ncbi:MAG: tRNA glutamyl-Q(34) synthetase GluQRS, partial [Pseudomonadota bacterium]